MNSDIISTKVAARLPDKIQSLVNSLDRAELRVLRATLSRHHHFDFLELPLELREAIYEYVFEQQSGQWRRHLSRKSGRSKDNVMCPTEILSTCRHIYHEGSSVLYRLYSAKLKVNPKFRVFGCQLQDIDAAPLTGFRRLEISIHAKASKLYIEYGKGKKGSLGIMLSNWADMLVAALQHTDPSVYRTIDLKFRLEGWSQSDAYWADDLPFSIEVATLFWFRTQTAAALQEMRQDLRSRLPATALTVTSDVEDGYSSSGLSVRRKDAYYITLDSWVWRPRRKVTMKMDNCKSQILEIDVVSA